MSGGPDLRSPRPIPGGARILHIGPHKTGTTAVQGAFHLARRAAAAQGVRYAGPDRHAGTPVKAAVAPHRASRSATGRWRSLVAEVRAASERRVLISSEWLAEADADAARRIVADLGGPVGPAAVHVIVTLRPLLRVLPSQWQQYVAGGLETAYEPWLHSVLDDPDLEGGPTQSFWRRHRHDRLVERWTDIVGPSNVTLVIGDERDHEAILRAFEWLLELRAGTLVAEDGRANRSMTLVEAEQVRAINRLLNDAVAAEPLRQSLGLHGAVAALRARTPRPAEPRIETPAWATDRALEIGASIVEGLRRGGAQVVGDLEDLLPARGSPVYRSSVPAEPSGDAELEVAATAAMGVLTAAGLARGRRRGAARRSARARLMPISTGRMGRVVVGRGRGFALSSTRLLRRRAVSAPARGGTGSDARDGARPLTALEERLLTAFEAAVEAEGLPRSVFRRVMRDGVLPELLERGPDGQGAATTVPEVGSALAMGVIRAAGLLPGRPGGRRLPPPLSTIETPEVAAVSTPMLLLELARRFAAVPLRRRA